MFFPEQGSSSSYETQLPCCRQSSIRMQEAIGPRYADWIVCTTF
jgi:hypothetical protein